MRYPIILFLTLLSGICLFTACHKDDSPPGPADAIYVRFKNDTGIDLYDLYVKEDSTQVFGDLKDNQKSDYLTVVAFLTIDGTPSLNMHAKGDDGNERYIAWLWPGLLSKVSYLDKGYYTVRLYREKGSDTIYQEFD